MSQTPGSPQRIKAAQRRAEALELRLAGCTYQAIGERLGCSYQRVQTIIKRELERLTAQRTEAAQALVTQECERLDRLQLGLWGKAVKGDIDAVNTLLRLMNRRAKLLGLDTPTTLGVNVSRVSPITLSVVEEVVDGPSAQGGGEPNTPPPAQCAETISDF
jgi:hypothetical protein